MAGVCIDDSFFWGGTGYVTGILFFYKALAIGDVTPIVLITVSYPLVTVFLAFLLLKEPISLQKIVGAFMTVAGICLISI